MSFPKGPAKRCELKQDAEVGSGEQPYIVAARAFRSFNAC
jgi:hypothetical protein